MTVQACAEIVRKGDPERFMATMAAPPALREKLFPVYAMNVEVARAPWVTQEPIIAEMRLQWWADAIEEIRTGAPVRRHEVVTPLAGILTPEAANRLADLVEARRRDISRDELGDWSEARDYVARTSGHLMAAAASVCGCERGLDLVQEYGCATGMAAYFIAQPVMARQGRHRIAGQDDRDRISMLAAAELVVIDRLGGEIPRSAHAAARTAWLARMRLKRIASDPDARLDGGPEASEFMRRLELLRRVLLRRP